MKRYELFCSYDDSEPLSSEAPAGEWVRYEDALALQRRITELERKLITPYISMIDTGVH